LVQRTTMAVCRTECARPHRPDGIRSLSDRAGARAIGYHAAPASIATFMPWRASPIMSRILQVSALALLLLPSRTSAQESRTAEIEAAQADKAAHLTPPAETRTERILERAQELISGPPVGLIPEFASIYSGGGFTLGAGYQRFIGDKTTWVARGFYSIRNYKLLDVAINSPGHAHDRVDYTLKLGWRDATQVGFYGIGQDTRVEDRANFRFNETFAGGEVRARAPGYLIGGGSVYFQDFRERDPQGSAPEIDDKYTPATAPLLGTNPTYFHSIVFGGMDWRPSPGYARSGGFYEVRYHNMAGVDHTPSFDRLDTEIIQHIPILRETWVVSLRGRMQTTLDGDVPYFLMPSLGSGSTLRAYHSQRFRDLHSLLLQGEWRWFPNRLGMDVAIFYDAGKVAAERRNLDFHGMAHDVGIGIRFHSLVATPLRVEVAKGHDGWNVVWSGSHAF
jgi:hypothetical protein